MASTGFASFQQLRPSALFQNTLAPKSSIFLVPTKEVTLLKGPKPDIETTAPSRKPPHAQDKCILFTLPPELRLLIYEYVLASALGEPLERSACYAVPPLIRACGLVWEESINPWKSAITRAVCETQHERNKAYIASIPHFGTEEEANQYTLAVFQAPTISGLSLRLMRLYWLEDAAHRVSTRMSRRA